MKYLLSSLFIILIATSCTANKKVNSESAESNKPSIETINTLSGSSLNTAVQAEQTIYRKQEKKTYYNFEECAYYRCKKATDQSNPNTSIQAPTGYQFLEIDALPKDYLLVIKDEKVFSYKPSTEKITPFTVDTTKQQLTLTQQQGITAKEAFNKPEKYLFVVFTMNNPSISEDIGPGVFLNYSATPTAIYVYDGTKDTLIIQKNSNPAGNFIGYNHETSEKSNSAPGELTYSIFQYDGIHNRTISWFGHNHEVFRGPWGDYMPSSGPLKVMSLDGKLIKNIPWQTVDFSLKNDGDIFSTTYKKKPGVDRDNHPLSALESISVLQAGEENLKERILRVSPEVTAYLEKESNGEHKSFLENFTYGANFYHFENNKLILGHEDVVIFTLEKDAITKVEFQPSI